MPSPIFLSRPSAGFTAAAVLRGAQLAFVGTYRALQNPELAKHGYYRKAVKLMGFSLILELIVRFVLGIARLILKLGGADAETTNDLIWITDIVLNWRQLLLFLCKDESMDDLFLMSLKFVDYTNSKKHPGNDRLFGRLTEYKPISSPFKNRRPVVMGILKKFSRRAYFSAGSYACSFIPLVGPYVLPFAAFRSFKNVAGGPAAGLIFGVGVFCPRRWLILFLSTYWGSRAMMNNLLQPYFSRLPFSKNSKSLWLENRQGILFGFAASFYILTKVPYLGLFIYGLASASAAYLITKISDPIPKRNVIPWTEEQAVWTSENVRAHAYAPDETAKPRNTVPQTARSI